MLTAERFSQLSINDQVTTALSNGQELLERIFVNNIIKLYLLDGFYVEIWYQQITNRITRVGVMNIEDVLHLYENQINITDLFR